MAPPEGGHRGAAASSGEEDEDAKNMFDRIGKDVHKKAKEDALPYNNALKGILSNTIFSNNEKLDNTDVCQFDHTKHTNVTNGKSNPCYGRQAVRFSNTEGSECYWNRIKGNDKNNEAAACAPFRRLHMCDRNLEEIEPEKIISTDNLLVDVLLAAKYEGESIRNEYDQKKDDYKLGLCTVLARSFADIGDIIRGRDLYRRDSRTDKLEENLKVIFGNIYKELTSTSDKNGELQTRYNDESGNYYQLREDWWEVNRQQVWNAITCKAKEADKYFRESSYDKGGTYEKCRCAIGNVLTNFDYVPQFLRWFEEWAEDFCRKKKHKLKDVKTNCRDEKEKYCSGNGYDCTKTIYKKGKLVIGNNCTKCSVWCRLYEKWIDNQKKEFLKQRKKCRNEIPVNGRQRRSVTTTNYDGYESKFYEKFKSTYDDVNKFLQLLNKEATCKAIGDEKEKINFDKEHDFFDKNINSPGTFYHSEYCEVCPDCGVKHKGNKWEQKNNGQCDRQKLYTISPKAESTDINVLSFGDKGEDIRKKIDDFCNKTSGSSVVAGGSGDCGTNSDSSLCEKWKCYEFQYVQKVKNGQGEEEDEDYDKDYENVKNAGGLCILENKNKKEKEKEKKSEEEPEQFQKTFNDFFYFWIRRFLNDSMYWRGKVNSCINKSKREKCKNDCEKLCGCFLKWITQKKTEWMAIKEQFRKQDDIVKQVNFIAFSKDRVLEDVLELEQLFQDIKDGYGNAKELEGIKKLLDEEKKKNKEEAVVVVVADNENKTTIDKLLQHEGDEAGECLDTHKDEEKCDEDEEAAPPQVTNPCSGGGNSSGSSTKYPALVNQIAHQMHDDALAEASKRGLSLLKADALEGKYISSGEERKLKNICEINIDHSNATLSHTQEPCQGKDEGRFKIGTPWTGENKVNTTHLNLFMPPRRQHMCTSNLENLNVGSVTSSTNVNDTFLVDVLLAAKEEAEDIKKKYKEIKDKNGLTDDKTVCRAMKNSFADIGDIIRGRDLWDDKDQVTLQDHLKTIFGHIHSSLNGKGKYDGDDAKHTKLRSDWWEANRHQIWKAMKCALKSDNIPCNNHAPLDDYVPQRLRWMTEWAEWFCKMQKEEYGELVEKCGECMQKGQGGKECTKDDNVCTPCKQACDAYGEKIRTWREQWTKMDSMYQWIYLYAKNDADSPGPIAYGGDKVEKHVFDFFREVYKQNKASDSRRSKRSTSDKSDVYANAAGYIHQEAKYLDCETQSEFCEKKNGETSTSAGKENEKYAFKNPPNGYDEACDCENRENTPVTPPPPPPPPPVPAGPAQPAESEKNPQEPVKPTPAPEEPPSQPQPAPPAPSKEPGSTPSHGVEPAQDAKEPAENKGDTKVEVKEDKTPAESQPKEKQRQATRVKPPKNVLEHPAVIPALMSSTIMWSIGIGFATFTYFFLK
ncbi:hypothetical protein PFFCH_04706, partial [Plasmodium falciparum FCH/4]